MFSSPSYAKWTKIGSNADGNTFFIDYGKIRKHGGYVYFWVLTEQLKPSPDGSISYKTYHQGDCKLFRFKDLSYSYYKEPMGGGTGNPITPPDKWDYATPNSSIETILKSVCSR